MCPAIRSSSEPGKDASLDCRDSTVEEELGRHVIYRINIHIYRSSDRLWMGFAVVQEDHQVKMCGGRYRFKVNYLQSYCRINH